MIDQRILEILGAIKISTILTPTRIAFCSPVNQTTSTSNAVIYDTDEKKILAKYEGKKNKQIMFFRTSEPNIIVCANSNLGDIKEYKVPQNRFRDLSQDIDHMSRDLHSINFILDPGLIYPLTLQILMPPLEWLANNVFIIDGTKFFVEQSRMRTKTYELDLDKPEHNIIETNRSDYFYMCSNYSINFSDLAYCGKHEYKKFDANMISARLMDNQLMLGCPKAKYSNGFQINTFKLGSWSVQKRKWIYTAELDDTIQKLTYIPEKEIAVGIVEKYHADYFYIFNKKMKYKIIKTESAIADIAIFDKDESLILFTNGKMQALESYINPVYHNKYHAILDSELKSLPKELVGIIEGYANNPFSMFNHKVNFSEKAKNFLKLNR
jgi:hypothetical protein